ncbi:hypothetical protein BGW38_006683 [Lunasporangiospora selenospora]|uniref:Uncharacterized protein n=1 Tax=Lunasporangiospora selenospora TaxID=979761 RepID=A0A9P6G2S2_9FUNG|nr:hypothetical protein BGW38_006683 [Lunasporangiospora selenospora]
MLNKKVHSSLKRQANDDSEADNQRRNKPRISTGSPPARRSRPKLRRDKSFFIDPMSNTPNTDENHSVYNRIITIDDDDDKSNKETGLLQSDGMLPHWDASGSPQLSDPPVQYDSPGGQHSLKTFDEIADHITQIISTTIQKKATHSNKEIGLLPSDGMLPHWDASGSPQLSDPPVQYDSPGGQHSLKTFDEIADHITQIISTTIQKKATHSNKEIGLLPSDGMLPHWDASGSPQLCESPVQYESSGSQHSIETFDDVINQVTQTIGGAIQKATQAIKTKDHNQRTLDSVLRLSGALHQGTHIICDLIDKIILDVEAKIEVIPVVFDLLDQVIQNVSAKKQAAPAPINH